MPVQPYLYFEGRCEEAIEFYRGAAGAEVTFMMRYKESPDPNAAKNLPPGSEEKIMHASLMIGGSVVMVSDGHCNGELAFKGFALTYATADETVAQRVFAALSEGGKPFVPMTKTFFSPAFGMLTDKFGVMWIVMVSQPM